MGWVSQPFVDALAALGRPLGATERERIETALVRVTARASQPWSWTLDTAIFQRSLAQAVIEADDFEDALAALHAADFYLATSCAHGIDSALEAFSALFGQEIDSAIRKAGLPPADADDLRQRIWQKLFVHSPQASAAISRYSGAGGLRGWVRMTAARTLIDQKRLRGPRREVSADEQVLEALLEPEVDPELAYLKEHYRREFTDCVARALGKVHSRARSVLKYSLADSLPIDDIGQIYGVHRATAARWLAKAKAELIDRLRDELGARFSVDAPEYTSILRLVRSGVQLNFGGPQSE